MTLLLSAERALRHAVENPFVLMRRGVALLLLSVVLVASLRYSRHLDAPGRIPLLGGTLVVALLAVAYSHPPLLVAGGGLAFGLFFGLALSLTVVILYHLRRVPIGGR